MAEKARSTQSIVNSFPGWSNIRQDEQSIGQQFMNSVGVKLDDIRKQLARLSDNYYLSTSIISDIDVYYKVQLPDTYTFTKDDDDDTDFIYTPPSVSGLADLTKYPVVIADNNDIETFWYIPAPDRISLEDTVEDDHFIASGYVGSSPFSPLLASGLHIANHITVTVDGGTEFVGTYDNGLVRRGLVQIQGFTREGTPITEELIFVHNDTQRTLHEFSKVIASGLRIYGIEDRDVATISFTSANFNSDDYAVFYELDETTDGDDMPLFWALGSGVDEPIKTLDLRKYQTDDLELRLEGFTSKDTIIQQELLNASGVNIIPQDLTVEPHSDNLWVVDSGTLYVYDNALPYPNMSLLEGKDYHANAVLESSSYYVVLGEEIGLDYIWRRPIQGMVAHRAWVIKPDGTKKSLEDGSEVTYHTDRSSWVFGEPRRRKIRNTEFYTLDQRGDWVFCLESRYTDDSQSIDKRIVTVASKQPRAQFSLESLGITTAQGIDFDSEYNLWILNASGVKYQINRHYDRMLVDFDRKILYFKEPYDQVYIY